MKKKEIGKEDGKYFGSLTNIFKWKILLDFIARKFFPHRKLNYKCGYERMLGSH